MQKSWTYGVWDDDEPQIAFLLLYNLAGSDLSLMAPWPFVSAIWQKRPGRMPSSRIRTSSARSTPRMERDQIFSSWVSRSRCPNHRTVLQDFNTTSGRDPRLGSQERRSLQKCPSTARQPLKGVRYFSLSSSRHMVSGANTSTTLKMAEEYRGIPGAAIISMYWRRRISVTLHKTMAEGILARAGRLNSGLTHGEAPAPPPPWPHRRHHTHAVISCSIPQRRISRSKCSILLAVPKTQQMTFPKQAYRVFLRRRLSDSSSPLHSQAETRT